MRTFRLIRDVDVTGLSGTGVVAEGVEFSDGITVLRWAEVTGPHYDRGVRATTVVHQNVQSVEALHGHDGATRIEWDASTEDSLDARIDRLHGPGAAAALDRAIAEGKFGDTE